MYEDRKETFSIKDIFLQLLFIVLLVFILIWLFPTKGYLDKRLDGVSSDLKNSLQPLYTRLFTDNILTMKEAAKSYYTTPRLPQNVGDTAKMTLGEMYEKGLLLELVDSNNTACDTTKSYIELTKMEDEYQLKTVLSCSDKEAFVIEYLGCYDYCNGKLCSKNQPTQTEDVKKYKYQYGLTTGGTCGNYGSWSDWTNNQIEENNITKVDTKTEKAFDHYEQIYGVTDTKYVDEAYYENQNFGYSKKTIKRTTTYSYSVKTTTKIAGYAKKSASSDSTVSYSTRKMKRTTTYDYSIKNSTKIVPYAKKVTSNDTVIGYSTRKMKKTTTYAYSYRKTQSGEDWVSAGRVEFTSPKCGNSPDASCTVNGVYYQFVSSRKELDCENACRTVNYYTYDMKKSSPKYTTEKFCPEGQEDTGSNCQKVEYYTQNYCAQGEDNGSGCVIKANNTVLYCEEGSNNGTGCAVTTSEKFCPAGQTDNGSGCTAVTYFDQKYCAQGTDNGSGCTIKANKTILYCTEGVDNGSGCTIVSKQNFCPEGQIDTGSSCQKVEYIKQNYCATGTDNGSGCTANIKKTRKVAQLIYGYKNGDAVYKNVTYYRSKTKTCVGGSTDYQWSESNNDSALKAKGYTLTGATQEIK